jgi:hypothetical protein
MAEASELTLQAGALLAKQQYGEAAELYSKAVEALSASHPCLPRPR